MISAMTSNPNPEPDRTQQDRYHSPVGLPQIDKTAHNNAWRDLTGNQFPTVSRSGTPFREVFEQSEDAIVLLDPSSWRIVDANPSAVHLYGYSKHTLLEGGIGLFMKPVERERFMDTVLRHDGKNSLTIEAVRHIAKDGRRLAVRIRCWPMTFHSITLVYCRFRDISYRVQLEQEAELSHLATSRFVPLLGKRG